MSRPRTAIMLAVVAVLAVVATVVVALRTRDEAVTTGPPLVRTDVRVVADPTSGARFEVPAGDWEVRGRRARVYYADDRGRPTVVVHGPAVFRAGYCTDQPRGSSQAFAGFTRQPFDAWVDTIGGVQEQSTEGGVRRAVLRRAVLRPRVPGPCAAAEVDLAMVTSHGVRVVLVADAGALGADEVDTVLGSLELAEPDVAH